MHRSNLIFLLALLVFLSLPVESSGSRSGGCSRWGQASVAAAQTESAEQGESSTPSPRYFQAIKTELEAMHITATCEVTDANRGTCHYMYHGRRSDHDFDVKVLYSDDSDAIYMYLDHFLMAPRSDPGTTALLTRLMSLNWSMLAGKFEWDTDDGEIRLSVTAHTDSNFDRRTFRNLLNSLVLRGDRYFMELQSLLTTEETPEVTTHEAPHHAPGVAGTNGE